MPSGRLTEYCPEVLIQTKEYIQGCIDEPYTLVKTEGKDSTTWENKLRVNLPTKERLALKLGVSRPTVYKWAEKYPEFSELLEELMAIQADRLVQGGLSGDYNPTISKVMLSNHGYIEKNSVEQNMEVEVLSEKDKKKLFKFLKY